MIFTQIHKIWLHFCWLTSQYTLLALFFSVSVDACLDRSALLLRKHTKEVEMCVSGKGWQDRDMEDKSNQVFSNMNVLKETISACWCACASVLKMKASWKCSFRNSYSVPFYSTSLLLVDLLSIPGWKRRWTLLLKLCNNLNSRSCNHIYSSNFKNLTQIWLGTIGTIWVKKKKKGDKKFSFAFYSCFPSSMGLQ